MNFIDSAIHLLSATPQPVHVDELCRLAIEQELLDKVGKNPLRSMKGRLTTELKRGDDSRVERIEKDLWQLRGAVDTASAGIEVETTVEVEAAVADAAAVELEAAVEEPSGPVEIEIVPGEPNPELEDVLAPTKGLRQVAASEVPDDESARALYADESTDGPLPGLQEYRDELTNDEDRPMLPEIVARRDRHRRPPANERGRRRRERGGPSSDRGGRTGERTRDKRSDRDGRSSRGGRNPATDQVTATEQHVGNAVPAPTASTASTAPVALAAPTASIAPLTREGVARFYMPGNATGDGAAKALASVNGSQSVQIKQLAEMMRKRGLWSGEAEATWPALQAALIADEASRRAAGHDPTVLYQGRGLFRMRAGGPDRVAAAAAAAADAATRHRVAVHEGIRTQLQALTCGQFEAVAHAFLAATGYAEISWIKRVEPSTYAVATCPDGAQLLVGARAGGDPVDRRGVGELRMGVEAKDMVGGLLLAPAELSEAATAELVRSGRQVRTLCGDAFVAALIRAGVGVVAQSVPVVHFDDRFFDELTRG